MKTSGKKQLIYRIAYLIVTLLCISFIFSQSLMDAGRSSGESGRLVELLNSISFFFGMGSIFTQGFVRACAHLFEFGVLGLFVALFVNSFPIYTRKAGYIAIASCIVVAVLDETIQLSSDGRAFQFGDIGVDTCGAALSVAILLTVLSFRKRRRIKRKDTDELPDSTFSD